MPPPTQKEEYGTPENLPSNSYVPREEDFITPVQKRKRVLTEMKKRHLKLAKRPKLSPLEIPSTVDVDDGLNVPHTPQPGALPTSPFAVDNLSDGEPGKVSRVCYLDGSQTASSNSAVRKGTTYLCSSEWRQNTGLANQSGKQESGVGKLFYSLGGGFYLDKPYSSAGYYSAKAEVESLRLGLWHVNGIQKHQRAGSRYSVTLDFDAIHILKSNAAEIERAMKICDSETFLGFTASLGRSWFLTVEHDNCSVTIRRWFLLNQNRGDPEAELLPGRDGFKLGYDQFRKLRLFLEKHLDQYLPSFKSHVFACNKADHTPKTCPICSIPGRLPLERNIQRLLGKLH